MWKNLLLVPLSLLVGFLIAEGIARIWIPLPAPYPIEPGLLVHDVRGVWILEPGYRGTMDNGIDFRAKQVSITRFGTRRVPCAENHSDGSARLFLIGDSQTFGYGLSDEETWASRLQCRLNETTDLRFKVHNLGVPGINVDQYFNRADKIVAPAVRPGDLVMVGVTWNDLHTYQARPSATGLAPTGVEAGSTSVQEAFEPRLSKPPRRYQGPTWRYRLYRKTGILIPTVDSVWGFVASMNYVSSLFRYISAKARLVYYRIRGRDVLFRKIPPHTFDNNFLLLDAIAERLQGRGVRVVVVLLPNRLFFDDYYYRSYSQGGRAFPQRDFLSYVAEPRCARLALRCVSMFGALATDSRDRHTFEFDGHYNPLGAERIATALAEFVQKLGPEGPAK